MGKVCKGWEPARTFFFESHGGGRLEEILNSAHFHSRPRQQL